jgi:hypothetical protein
MKRVTLTIVLSGVLSLLFGQQIDAGKFRVNFGAALKGHKSRTSFKIVDYDKKGVYVLSETKGKYAIENYDNQNNLVKSEAIELKFQKKKRSLEFLLGFNDQLHLFTSFQNQKLKKNFLFEEKINKSTLLPTGELKKVAEIDYSEFSKYKKGTFNYKLSRDSNNVLVYYNLPSKKKAPEKFGFHVYNKTLDKSWHKEVELPYKDELFTVTDYKVDNLGNVHLLGKVYQDKPEDERRDEPNYNFVLLSYLDSGKKLKKHSIKCGEYFLKDMQVEVTDSGDIVCAGFYSSFDSYSVKGAFFLRIDEETKAIKAKKFKEFNLDFITQNLSDKQEAKTRKKAAKGKNVEMHNYVLEDLILKSNGGALLLGENSYTYLTTHTSSNGNGGTTTTTTTHYVNNDIIAISISPDGEIEWTQKIAKKQHTTNDGAMWSSYSLMIDRNKMYFFFNDNVENVGYKEGQDKFHTFVNYKKGVVMCVELDSKGNKQRSPLFETKVAQVFIRPGVNLQIADKEIVVFGAWKKVHQMISFKLK